MNFFEHMMQQVDPEIVYWAVSIGAFATSILIGKAIKEKPVLPLASKRPPLSTSEEILKDIAKHKKASKKLKINILKFNSTLKTLKFRYKHIDSIRVYNEKFEKALNIYKKNRSTYSVLITKLNAPHLNSLLNLKQYKILLRSQDAKLKSLVVKQQVNQWFWFINPDYDLFTFFCSILVILIIYFLLTHWKVARYLFFFIFACYTTFITLIWRLFLYQPTQTLGSNLWSFLKAFIFI